MTISRILSFFKDKRDFNIHTEPVKPAQDVTIAPSPGIVHMSVSLVVVHTDANGNIINERESPPETEKPEIKAPDRPATATTRYRFTDWPGHEDVPSLCQIYLDQLERLVEEGMRKEFLTG